MSGFDRVVVALSGWDDDLRISYGEAVAEICAKPLALSLPAQAVLAGRLSAAAEARLEQSVVDWSLVDEPDARPTLKQALLITSLHPQRTAPPDDSYLTLLVPTAKRAHLLFDRAVLAWTGDDDCRALLSRALPLLQRVASVSMIYAPQAGHASIAGLDELLGELRRQDVEAVISFVGAGEDIRPPVLRQIRAQPTELLLMSITSAEDLQLAQQIVENRTAVVTASHLGATFPPSATMLGIRRR